MIILLILIINAHSFENYYHYVLRTIQKRLNVTIDRFPFDEGDPF